MKVWCLNESKMKTNTEKRLDFILHMDLKLQWTLRKWTTFHSKEKLYGWIKCHFFSECDRFCESAHKPFQHKSHRCHHIPGFPIPKYQRCFHNYQLCLHVGPQHMMMSPPSFNTFICPILQFCQKKTWLWYQQVVYWFNTDVCLAKSLPDFSIKPTGETIRGQVCLKPIHRAVWTSMKNSCWYFHYKLLTQKIWRQIIISQPFYMTCIYWDSQRAFGLLTTTTLKNRTLLRTELHVLFKWWL